MKATAAFVTLLTSGGRKERAKRRVRGQNELAGAVNVGGCCRRARTRRICSVNVSPPSSHLCLCLSDCSTSIKILHSLIMVIFFQDLSLLESDESINYLSSFFVCFFLSFRGRKQHIYLSSYQSSLPLCQKRHKHRERLSRRKDELMAMERSASLHLSAGRWRQRPSWEGVNMSPGEVAGNGAACPASGDPGSQAPS